MHLNCTAIAIKCTQGRAVPAHNSKQGGVNLIDLVPPLTRCVQAIKDLETPNPFKDLVDGMAHAVHTVLMDPTHKIRPWSKAVRKGRMQLADYDSWMETFTQQ